jgi:hypothetical protein
MLARNYKTGSWLGLCSIVLAAIPLSFLLIPSIPTNDLIGFLGIGGSLVMAVGAGLITTTDARATFNSRFLIFTLLTNQWGHASLVETPSLNGSDMFPGSVCHQQVQSQQESLAPLEIRLAEPLRWENGCLAVKVARINRASGPLFLTKIGPYFDIALDVSKDDSQTGDDLEWVNIYGVNDILDTRSDSVAPGSSVHNNFCFGPTVWVTNIHRRTRREIAVRGKVRIEVSYFLNEKDARSYEKNEEQGPLGRTRQWARIFVEAVA